MSFDNEFDEPFDNNLESGKLFHPAREHDPTTEFSRKGLDPMDFTDPSSAYFFLSDDAQEEIVGGDRKKMKCCSCQNQFYGEIYDRCPNCESFDTEEVSPGTNY